MGEMPRINCYVVENDRNEDKASVQEIFDNRRVNNLKVIKQLRASDLDEKVHDQTGEEADKRAGARNRTGFQGRNLTVACWLADSQSKKSETT